MELEAVTKRQSVREGYSVLLRAQAEILLPQEDFPVMRSFYERISEACLSWVTEIYGETLRNHFLGLTDIRDRSRFRTQNYRFWMRVPWQSPPYLTLLCESERSALDGSRDFYRISHTWNTAEESILPFTQVIKLFKIRSHKRDFPFEPDGGYREGDHFFVYKNANSSNGFLEIKIPLE